MVKTPRHLGELLERPIETEEVPILWVALAVSVNADPPVATSVVAAGPRAVLRWKARSEKGVYGYLVYRANVENGRYQRVNAEIIHVSTSEFDEPSEYRFVDRNVETGRTYFYYLETIGDDESPSSATALDFGEDATQVTRPATSGTRMLSVRGLTVPWLLVYSMI